MKAITIRAPWSLAIAAGRKTIENRGRPTAYRGPLAIHSAATWSKEGARDLRIRNWWWGPDLANATLDATDFSNAFRHILAVADLVDCHQADQTAAYATCCHPWGEREYLRQPGKPAWHLVLDNVRRLGRPVPAVGKLTVPWALPDDVAEQVRGQLEPKDGAS